MFCRKPDLLKDWPLKVAALPPPPPQKTTKIGASANPENPILLKQVDGHEVLVTRNTQKSVEIPIL